MSRRLIFSASKATLASLLVLFFAGATLSASTTTRKKQASASTSLKAKSRLTAAHLVNASQTTSSSSSQKRTASTHRRHVTHKRMHYYSVHVSPARRAQMVEEIGDTLKDPPDHAIAYDSALDGFFAQLASYESATHNGEKPTSTVRVLQWGDSHTAADMFTGEARRVFQQQFGDGGIGYSYAGYPYPGFRIFGSQHSQSPGWTTRGNKFLQLGDGEQLGMGGLSISTQRPNEKVTFDASCTSLELQYLQQPGGGSLRFTDNGGEPTLIPTDATEMGPGTFRYSCTPGDHHFELETADYAPVTLLGWVATQPGVTWEMIGINGAEAPLILRWDQKLYSQYLKDNSPALIVLAYGTNEAASSSWDEESYKQTFASLIDTIHSYVPESSILVVGPADRSLLQHHSWHAFSGTEKIIKAQRAVCHAHACAYWDQRQRMGGFGSMQDWVYAGWAQPDHTHFTGDGYHALADALMADLMTGFQQYKDRHSPITETAVQGEASGARTSNP